jgi:hypothetical protein
MPESSRPVKRVQFECIVRAHTIEDQSGSPGKVLASGGITTPCNLLDVQMWIAGPRSTAVSNEPPLMLRVAGLPPLWCQSREPQLAQKAHSSLCPDAVGRDQNDVSPWRSVKSLLGTVNEIPNAEEDCLRHSVQWHTYRAKGSLGTLYRTWPHWHPPNCLSSTAGASDMGPNA